MIRAATERICPLPPGVVAQIKSSTAITSLSDVVLGLLENSLDAQAQKITVHFDFSKGYCAVEDDGIGINPSDFEADGGLTKPFNTSKMDPSICTLGTRGLFLSAAAALSLLSITSRRSSHKSLASLVQHRSDVLARVVPAPPQHEISNPEHGTRVTVQDLFGNMPVRVKQRAASATQAYSDKEIDSLKRQIVALILASYRPINIQVTDSSSNRRILTIRAKIDLARSVDQERISTWLLHPPDPAWISGVLLQSSLTDHLTGEEWVKVSARTGTVRATGIISTRPMPSKQLQYLSLGLKPMHTDGRSNPLYDDINKVFQASRFGSIDECDESKKLARSTDRRYKQDGPTMREMRGAPKSLDRWPMFCIRVTFVDRPAAIDALDNAGILSSISRVLRALVVEFLKDNNFRPRAVSTRHRAPQRRKHSLARSASDTLDVFGSWSRIKSSKSHACKGDDQDISSRPVTQVSEEPPLCNDACESREDEVRETVHGISQTEAEQFIACLDPVSRRKIFINRRTGMPAPTLAVTERPKSAPSTRRAGSLFSNIPAKSRPSTSTELEGNASWATRVLSSWNNPIFTPAESVISQITNETNMDILEPTTHCRHSCSDHGSLQFTRASSKISRSMLAGAQLIKQVDSKFLLIRVRTNNAHSLVMVDQHAADERVRVEALLEDLYTQPSIGLAKAIEIELTAREQDLLAQRGDFLSCFGVRTTIASLIQVKQPSNEATVSKGKIQVTHLPAVIAERCRLQPSLALDLLRSIIWSDDIPLSTQNSVSSARPPPPKALMDMINSRACRSAIMFNDVLSHEEGEALLRKLSTTSLPFQCAHGRTSMVPLVELGVDDGVIGELGEDEKGGMEDFAASWKRWRSQDWT